MYEALVQVSEKYSLVMGFAVIGVTMWFSYWFSGKFTKGRIHGSAIAIMLGLFLAYLGGLFTGGKQGIVDLPLLSGIGILGGSMLRDFAIVATGFGVNIEELKRAGVAGVMALFTGIFSSFLAGVFCGSYSFYKLLRFVGYTPTQTW
jgi:malonate transporter MadM subunit